MPTPLLVTLIIIVVVFLLRFFFIYLFIQTFENYDTFINIAKSSPPDELAQYPKRERNINSFIH